MSASPLDYLLFKQGMDKGRGHKTRIIDKMLISTKRQNKKSSRPSMLRKHRVVSIKWRFGLGISNGLLSTDQSLQGINISTAVGGNTEKC